MKRLRTAFGAIVLVSAFAAGCVVESDPSPPPVIVSSTGQLTLRWTVDEARDPNLCFMGGARTIGIVVVTTSGAFAGEFEADCADFSTAISTLAPGNYVASAELRGSNGEARTTTTEIEPFTIEPGSNLVLDVDFPADSFR